MLYYGICKKNRSDFGEQYNNARVKGEKNSGPQEIDRAARKEKNNEDMCCNNRSCWLNQVYDETEQPPSTKERWRLLGRDKH